MSMTLRTAVLALVSCMCRPRPDCCCYCVAVNAFSVSQIIIVPIMYICGPVDRQTALIGDLMQRWDVYISIKAKQRQPIQSVIIKSIEQNMSCVYEARRRILEFSSLSLRSDVLGLNVGVANGRRAEFESSTESNLLSSLSSMGEIPNRSVQIPNRSVQIPMSFSEDHIASRAGFTSSGSYTTMGGGEGATGKAGFTNSGTLTNVGGVGVWEGEEKEGEDSSPPEITVDEPGTLYTCTLDNWNCVVGEQEHPHLVLIE